MPLNFYNVKLDPAANSIGPTNANNQYFNSDDIVKIDTLVRETIQNPTDNPFHEDYNKPVIVEYRKRKVKTKDIPEINNLRSVITALVRTLEDHKTTDDGLMSDYINHYKEALSLFQAEKIDVLQISDYNTKGLTGTRFDRKTNIGRFLGGFGWFDDNAVGGGSGGLGKLAPFQVSAVHCCFYSSFNVDNEYIYYGTGTYFSHIWEGQLRSGTIIIGDKNCDVLRSESVETSLGFLAERNNRGTDVFSLGFKSIDDWHKEIVKSVIRNFYGAILDKKLIVKVYQNETSNESIEISEKTIMELLDSHFDANKRNNHRNDLQSEKHTIESVCTYNSGQEYNTVINNLGHCKLKLLLDENASRIVSFMRGPRMHLFQKNYSSWGDSPYSAVFLTNCEDSNKILRKTEDSKHRDWIYENLGREIGKQIKDDILQFIKDTIKENCDLQTSEEFEIRSSILHSSNSKNSTSSADVEQNQEKNEVDIKESALIIPSFQNKQNTKIESGKVYVFNEEGELKKPSSTKVPPRQGGGANKRNKKKTTVSEMEILIYRTGEDEYTMFINSKVEGQIPHITFSIDGVGKNFDFIENITKESGSSQIPLLDKERNESGQKYGVFDLETGENYFKIKTKYKNQFEINISY